LTSRQPKAPISGSSGKDALLRFMGPIAFTATSARQWAKLSPDVRSRIDKRLTEFATTGMVM
jgi:hypothetical protein